MARILVMEDDFQVATIIRRILEGQGHTVRLAADGRTGVRLYREDPADLVITDVFMPGQDGIETLLELQGEFPALKIVVISGGGQAGPADALQDAELLGATRSLAKPFTTEALIGVVNEMLSGS